MKRIVLFAALVAIAAGCSRVEIQEAVTEGVPAPQITAYIGDGPTKTILETDSEGVGTIYWKPSDDIKVFYETTGVKYTSQNTEKATTAVFETTAIIGATESASKNRWGLYPFDSEATCDGSAVTTTIPASQDGVAGTFDDDLYVTLAHSENNMFTFFNVCGGIKFSLSRSDIQKITFKGNNEEVLAGKVALTMSSDLPAVSSVVSGEKTITLTPKTGSTFASGVYYYIICLPVEMAGGFTMTFETETQLGTFEYTAKAVTTKRSIFSKKDNIDSYATFNGKSSITNLSASGTANCYIVSAEGDYKFDATVKGESTESVGTPVSAEVVWESFGTSTTPNVGDLVSSVSLDGGYVYFTASALKGNALIAVKNSDDTILWSWHIWMTDAPVEQVYNNNAGTMMDRNLGATSATPGAVEALGLLYQWGRKDPFLGPSSISANTTAQSTITWPSYANSDETVGTVDYAIQHPTTFINYNSRNFDWYYTGATTCDNTRWGSEKGLYDPCPKGWQVPNGNNTGVWATGFGASTTWYDTWDSTNLGMNFGQTDKTLGTASDIWYPASGYRGKDGSLDNVGVDGNYWSCTPDGTSQQAYMLHFEYGSGKVVPDDYYTRTMCLSVRCLKQ